MSRCNKNKIREKEIRRKTGKECKERRKECELKRERKGGKAFRKREIDGELF